MAFFPPLHALFMMDQSQQNTGPRIVPVSSLRHSSVSSGTVLNGSTFRNLTGTGLNGSVCDPCEAIYLPCSILGPYTNTNTWGTHAHLFAVFTELNKQTAWLDLTVITCLAINSKPRLHIKN